MERTPRPYITTMTKPAAEAEEEIQYFNARESPVLAPTIGTQKTEHFYVGDYNENNNDNNPEASAEEGPWVFTLDDPSYDPVIVEEA